MPEQETKKIWESKSVVGGAVAMIIPILALFGVIGVEPERLADFIMLVISAVSAGVAIWGRIVATKKLTK